MEIRVICGESKPKQFINNSIIMSKLRFRVVETAFKKKAVEVATPTERPSEYFGMYVFNKEKMFK